VINSNSILNYLKDKFPFFNEKINELNNFYEFICENNPMLLNYYDEDNKQEDNKVEIVEEIKQIQTKYEDKYLDKFKTFPNEFRIDETEFRQENEEYERIKIEYEKNRLDTINAIHERLFKINEIQERGNIDHTKERYTENINAFGIDCLIKFLDIEEEYNEDQDDFDIEELYQDLLKHKEELLKKLDETEKMIMTEEEMRKKAREVIINKKLDKFMDNYILEHTPLGNIFMRYNNDKKSFEYFSNNTIPYRYLEPVGRRYVMTYWCKPIFVDIEEELKRAEIKFDEGVKIKMMEEKEREEEIKRNPKKILAQLKKYNKETKDQTMRPMKNRSNKNGILPPQIQANLPDVNKTTDKQLLKENANRYTWEGRLTNFSPLKKIDRKILDKKLAMTYADFKKIQQEEQNKK
jgi:hypothetical protein